MQCIGWAAVIRRRRKGWRTPMRSVDMRGPNALNATQFTAKGNINKKETAETVTLIERSSDEFDDAARAEEPFGFDISACSFCILFT